MNCTFATLLLLIVVDGALAQSPAAVDSTGVVAGFYQGPASSGSATGEFRLISRTGYTFTIDAVTGALAKAGVRPISPDGYPIPGDIYFTAGDCSGQAYTLAPFNGGERVRPGYVFSLTGTGIEAESRYYVAKTAAPLAIGSVPIVSGKTCTDPMAGLCFCFPSTQGPEGVAYPAQQNDPSVTGVPNVNFTPPVRIEVVPVSRVLDLLKDGFESSLHHDLSCQIAASVDSMV